MLPGPNNNIYPKVGHYTLECPENAFILCEINYSPLDKKANLCNANDIIDKIPF